MGILLGHRLRIGDPHILQHFHYLLGSFLFLHILMDDKWLAHLALNGKNRVQAGHGLLENNGNLISPDLAHILHRNICKVPPIEDDLPTVNIAIPVQ